MYATCKITFVVALLSLGNVGWFVVIAFPCHFVLLSMSPNSKLYDVMLNVLYSR